MFFFLTNVMELLKWGDSEISGATPVSWHASSIGSPFLSLFTEPGPFCGGRARGVSFGNLAELGQSLEP